MTVSYALREKGEIAQETRKRILQVASELGYRPNTSARAMVTGKFGSVALLLSSYANRSFLSIHMLDGIEDELASRELQLTVSKLPDEKLTNEGFVPKILRELMSDGLLINYIDNIPQRMLDMIKDHDIPSVWINSKQDYNCVHPDEFGAGQRATEHLLKLGHRRIALVNYSFSNHYSMSDRARGYESAMRQAGLSPQIFSASKPIKRADRPALAKQMLETPDRPTAVVAGSVSSVNPFLWAMRDLELEVPRDLSIVTFYVSMWNDNDAAVDVATIITPFYEVGRVATRMLTKKIADPHRPLPTKAIESNLIEGQTCASPPS